MIGMNSNSGLSLRERDHLQQSIRDILTTPIGTRVMRREYGSNVFQWIDAPGNRGTIIGIIAATAEALGRWETRLKLERVQVKRLGKDGRIELRLQGEYLPDNKPITVDGIVL